MNIEHLRKTLKLAWLNYYRQNRHWIMRLGVWVNYQDQRRPSASFILGVLSTLEPQLIQLLPLVVDLNSNPDRIVLALGLNFNPEAELAAVDQADQETPLAVTSEPNFRMLPSPTSNAIAPAIAAGEKKAKQPISAQANGPTAEGLSTIQPDSNSAHPASPNPAPVDLASSSAPSDLSSSRIVPPPPIPNNLISSSVEQTPPTPTTSGSSTRDVQSATAAKLPASTDSTSHSSQHPSRLPLDTAQLSAHELPDRGTTKTGRKRVRWD